MRRRGAQYWLWIDKRLPTKIHEDLLSDGRQVEVQVRITEQMPQVFIGIYSLNGALIAEESHDLRVGELLATALTWGVQRARAIIIELEPFRAPHRPQLTLSPVIVDETILALRRMEMGERERQTLQLQDARNEYLRAKEAMLSLMRRPHVDSTVWAQHKERLQQAIDRRAFLLRTGLA